MKFISPKVTLYLYKSTIRPCMEYYCHVWAGAPSCYQINKRNGYVRLLVLQTLPLLKPQLTSLFYRYYFGRVSSELAELVPLAHSRGRSTCYSKGSHDFSVTIPRCYNDVNVKSFFSRTARILNYLPVECFPLNHDVSDY